MADRTAAPPSGASSTEAIRAEYVDLTRRKRLYGSILLIVFVAMLCYSMLGFS